MEKDPRINEDIEEDEADDGEDDGPKYTEEQLNDNLIQACKNNQVDEAAEWISFGANVQATDKNGWSPLIWAANNGNEDIVRLLLKNKAHNVYLNQTTEQQAQA